MEPSTKRKGSGLVVPAVVLALLGVQFALAFRGFDAGKGILGLLGAPGALLGWGGVVILAILLAWLIAGWVGRDLFGLQGPGGFAVRLVGCVALGVAIGGLCALLGGAAVGGKVGAWLADVLTGSFDSALLAALVLVLMAIPAFVLSISPFFFTGPVRGPGGSVPKDQLVELDPKPGLYEGGSAEAASLYPERRYDEDGNEIPIEFDGHDVGAIRFLDEESDEAQAASTSRRPDRIRPEPVDVEAESDHLPDGVRWADEEAEAAEPETEHDDGPDARVPLPDGVRYVDEDDEDEEDVDDEEEYEEYEEDEEDEEDYEDEEDEEDEVEAGEEELEPEAPIPPPAVDGAAALDALKDEEAGALYRAKLEGSGIFDDAPTPPPAPEPAAPKKKATPKKKAAPKKKATPKKKKLAPKKKKATPKKKTATPKKKKATPKKKKQPTTRKGARTTTAVDETYRKAVAVALERKAASSVLLSRRLGIGYAQARALIDVLVQDGILGDMTPSGSRPLLISEAEWKKRSG